MYEVHIYTSVSGKGPREQERSCFYRLETDTKKGPAGLENTVKLTATKNRAELFILNEALKRVNKKCRIVIHTESEYVSAGFNQGRINRWKENGWMSSRSRPVANREEWQKMLNLLYGKPFEVILSQNQEKEQGRNAAKR